MASPRVAARREAETAGYSAGGNWVVLPTYNEALNLEPLLRAVLALGGAYNVLVVDDSSPDGTAEIAMALAAAEPRIRVVRRPGKQGLGTAYVDGLQRALGLGADVVLQMDADFSHDPGDLERLCRALEEADVAIGSRYCAAGSTPGWPLLRRLPSSMLNAGSRILLGLPVRDITSGFKAWRREALQAIPLAEVRSRGFAFQVEMNWRAWQAGLSIVEVPIAFRERRLGQSKLSRQVAVEMGTFVLREAVRHPLGRGVRGKGLPSGGRGPQSRSAPRTHSSPR